VQACLSGFPLPFGKRGRKQAVPRIFSFAKHSQSGQSRIELDKSRRQSTPGKGVAFEIHPPALALSLPEETAESMPA